jgi:glycosyltransferase 2 family protein
VTRKLGRRLVAIGLVAAAGWFLVDAIAANWQALLEFEWEVDPGLLVTSIAAHVAVLVWGVWVWGRVLGCFAEERVPHGVLLRIWFLSNLAKYIPGKIFQFVAVAHLGRTAGVGPSVLLASLLVHTALTLMAAMVLAGFTLPGLLLPGVPPLAVGALVAVASALLVHPVLLDHALRVVGRLARRDVLRWRGRWSDGMILLVLAFFSWLIYGLAYYLFLVSLTPLPIGALPVLSGVNALSFVAGYLAIVTPGGLGVREAAMTALLLPFLPRSVAAVLAIAARLWTIAAEIVGGVVALMLEKTARTPGRSPDGTGSASGREP